MFSISASSLKSSVVFTKVWNRKCLIFLVLTVHWMLLSFSYNTMQCSYFSSWFGKKPQIVIKTALRSHVTCSYFLSSWPVPFFSFSCFPWLLFTLLHPCWQSLQFLMQHTIDSGCWCLWEREGQICSWEIVPQNDRFYMKWRLCIDAYFEV